MKLYKGKTLSRFIKKKTIRIFYVNMASSREYSQRSIILLFIHIVLKSTQEPLEKHLVVSQKKHINKYILNITPVFCFVIPPRVSPKIIVIMYHLVPTPESFEIKVAPCSPL
jgi:hypothetical protein